MKSKILDLFNKEKHRVLVSALAAGGVTAFYLLASSYPPGLLSYLFTLPALIGVVITALARVNDIGSDRTAWSWQLRRIALTATGATAVAYMYAPFGANTMYPTWLAGLAWWGFFLTWFTTPGMPPWHKYVFGEMEIEIPRHFKEKRW